MVRNCGFDGERQIGRNAVVADQAFEMDPGPFGFDAADGDPPAGARRDARHRRIERNPQASEAPPQVAIQIDEPQMQPPRNSHSYAFDGAGLRCRGGGTEVRIAGLRVSEYHASFTADLPM
jgi:hypothetical protein